MSTATSSRSTWPARSASLTLMRWGNWYLIFQSIVYNFPPPQKNIIVFRRTFRRTPRSCCGRPLASRDPTWRSRTGGAGPTPQRRGNSTTQPLQSHKDFFCSYQDFISAVTPGRLSGLKEAFRLDMEMFGYGDEDKEFGGGGGGGGRRQWIFTLSIRANRLDA